MSTEPAAAHLYQLYLSGTEAYPAEKLTVLDDGLASKDERIRKLCVEALNRMLEMGHFSRSGGSEHIGSGGALEDWQPKTYGEIFDYYRAALSRLELIALDATDPNCRTALTVISSHVRGLLSNVNLIDDVQGLISRLRKEHPGWYGAALGVNDWLYFDRGEADESYQLRLREYYDQLIPADPLDQIHYYSSGWATDVHDPDVSYDREGDNDHRYGQRKIHEIVDAATHDAPYFFPLLDRWLDEPTNSGWMALVRIASHVNEPRRLMEHLLAKRIAGDEVSVVASLLRNTISGAAQVDRNKALDCLKLALGVPDLSASSIEFLTAVPLDDALMRRAIEFVRLDIVEPNKVSAIAFRDILKTIDHDLIDELVRTLLSKGANGAWASVDFLAHVLYGADPKQAALVECLKVSMINKSLFDKSRYSNMDWYHWHDLVEKILDSGPVDNDFYIELVDFIIGVVNVEEFSVQLSFDDYAQKVLRRIISIEPRMVWEKYHDARAVEGGNTRYRVQSLFGADAGEPSRPGVLNEIPSEIYVPWMLDNKPERMPVILGWLQLFVGPKDDRAWNSEFVEFLDDHVDQNTNLDTIRLRLVTGSWWGPFSSKLEADRELLLKLRQLSKNSHVHLWINKTVSTMEQQISSERRRDANRDASDRA